MWRSGPRSTRRLAWAVLFLAARPPARPRAAVEHTREFIVQRRGRRDAGARFGAHTDRPWPARAPPTGALVTASSCACAILGSLSPAETRSPSAFQWLGRRLINRRTAGRRRCRRPRHVQGVAGPAGEMMMTTSNLGASISHRALRQGGHPANPAANRQWPTSPCLQERTLDLINKDRITSAAGCLPQVCPSTSTVSSRARTSPAPLGRVCSSPCLFSGQHHQALRSPVRPWIDDDLEPTRHASPPPRRRPCRPERTSLFACTAPPLCIAPADFSPLGIATVVSTTSSVLRLSCETSPIVPYRHLHHHASAQTPGVSAG